MPPRLRTDDGARNAAHLRGMNLERVLSIAIERQQPFTRAELVEATGLSVPTVGSLTTDLIRLGIVTDLGAGPSSGGRKPTYLNINAENAYVLAIDIGVRDTAYAVSDFNGRIIKQKSILTEGEPEE